MRELQVFRSQRQRMAPHRRPHDAPWERARILEVMRLRAWSVKQAAIVDGFTRMTAALRASGARPTSEEVSMLVTPPRVQAGRRSTCPRSRLVSTPTGNITTATARMRPEAA